MADEGDLRLFNAAQRVGDMVFEYVDQDPRTRLEDWRDHDVNPYFYQTDGGLLLKIYYSLPNSVCTPWGEYKFGGSGSFPENHLRDLLARLEATEAIPKETSSMGQFGPFYAIHRVGDIQLSEPRLREERDFVDYKKAKSAWTDMKAQLAR